MDVLAIALVFHREMHSDDAKCGLFTRASPISMYLKLTNMLSKLGSVPPLLRTNKRTLNTQTPRSAYNRDALP
jgi:hypothetical protein